MFEWDLIESCLTRACEEANESSESMFEQKKKHRVLEQSVSVNSDARYSVNDIDIYETKAVSQDPFSSSDADDVGSLDGKTLDQARFMKNSEVWNDVFDKFEVKLESGLCHNLAEEYFRHFKELSGLFSVQLKGLTFLYLDSIREEILKNVKDLKTHILSKEDFEQETSRYNIEEMTDDLSQSLLKELNIKLSPHEIQKKIEIVDRERNKLKSLFSFCQKQNEPYNWKVLPTKETCL